MKKQHKHNTNQQGFSVLEGIVIALVIVLLALGGWWVWHQTKKDEPKPSSNGSQTEGQSEPQPQDPSEGGKYLVITEWGLRFLLPEELRGDVKYGIFTFNSGDQSAYFASKKIASRSPGGTCDLASQSETYGQGVAGGTIAVSRSTTKPEDIDQRSFSTGSYWYTVDFGNGGECYAGDTGQDKGRFNSLMENAIRQLEPIE